jgi:hypothetical protein
MSRRTQEILERYRAAQSLDEADRARLLVAIRDRIASGAGIRNPCEPHTHTAASSLAKTASILPKIVVGLALAATSAAWMASLAHIPPRALVSPGLSIPPKGAPDVKAGDAPEPVAPSSAWAPASARAPAPALASARSPAPMNGQSRSGNALSARSHSQSHHPSESEAAMHASAPDPELATVPLEAPFDTADAPLPTTALASQPALAPASAATPRSTPMPALPSAFTPASAVTPPSVASRATNEVDEEVRLVGLAYSLLRDGAPARALVVLEEHERRFPNGRLVESRRVTRILALCQSGRTADARAERERFLSLYPRSPFSNRVRSACGNTTTP